MKKSIMISLAFFLFTLFVASFAVAETAAIPSYAMPIMETWNASTAEELRVNMATFFQNEFYNGTAANGPEAWQHQVKICFDKTTEELITDPQSWNLAITTSEKVDLQKLADKGLIGDYSNTPMSRLALHQWLLPEKVQNRIPFPPSPYRTYQVYCYHYDAETEEAIFLICKQEEEGGLSFSPDNAKFAEEMIRRRSIAEIRSTEGLSTADDYSEANNWTFDDLIDKPKDWDVATLFVEKDEPLDKQLDILDQAGLLYDFTQDKYFSQRDMDWSVPNVLFNKSGKIVAIPFTLLSVWDNSSKMPVLVLNAQSTMISRALEYLKYFVKSHEWAHKNQDMPGKHQVKYGFSIHRDEMDW